MYLIVLVLNKTEYLEDILEKFYDIGINGATVIDSSGMGRTICNHITIVGGLRSLFDDCREVNKTIFSVVKNESMIRKVTDGIEEVIGDLDTAGKGIFFSFPLHQVKGFISEPEDD